MALPREYMKMTPYPVCKKRHCFTNRAWRIKRYYETLLLSKGDPYGIVIQNCIGRHLAEKSL